MATSVKKRAGKLTLAPLSVDEALAALLKTPPPQRLAKAVGPKLKKKAATERRRGKG